MDSFTIALRTAQGNLRDISSTISKIYKNIPENYIPAALREAHDHLNYLHETITDKPAESALPQIQPRHTRSKTSESKTPVPQDPCSFRGSSVAREKFHLQTPSTKFSRLHSQQSYQRPKFSRVSHARVVPKATRYDPIANPAQISNEEKDLGVFNIVNKGLVPKNANLTEFFKFPSLKSKKIEIGSFSSQFQSPAPDRKIFSTAVESTLRRRRVEVSSPEAFNLGEFDSTQSKKIRTNTKSVVDKFYLIVKNGKFKESLDLASFKKNYQDKWRTMQQILTQVENYCKTYRYPKVVIDASKLYLLEIDEVRPLTPRRFKKCVLNSSEIANTMKSHKVAYRGKAGRHLAAVKIQTAYRTFYTARQFRHLRALNSKAKLIQLYFRLYLRKLETKNTIKGVRQERIEQFKLRQRQFKQNWSSIKTGPRTEIHLGSLHPDLTHSFYYAKQNSQLMRVYALADPNLSIIYVSPVPLHSDITEYYYLSLQLCQIPDIRNRLTFITPSHGISMNSQYSTSKLLFLASGSINEIKSMIKDRPAYIVPNEVYEDDIWLSDLLGIPLLYGDPEVVPLVSTKIGCRSIFETVGIKVPLQVSDLPTPDIFYRKFATLVLENLQKDFWMLKINTESRSRGIAFIDVSKCKSVSKFRKMENLREDAWEELHTELVRLVPLIGKVVMLTLWESWHSYLLAFCASGGVIQETPTSRNNIASPCLSLLIEPDGAIRYLCAVDRMQSRDYLNTGVFFPQSSLPQAEILSISYKVGKELYERGVFGYMHIELVAFPDPYNDGGLPVYWGIDLKFTPGIIASSYYMFHVMVGGHPDMNSGKYYIEFEEQEDEFTIVEDLFGDGLTNLLTTSSPSRVRTHYGKPQVIRPGLNNFDQNFEDFNKFDERCYFFCWHVEHPDLKDLSIGGLFHMCRLESMTFSIETCKGSVFTIYELLNSHHFGIMAIGNNRQDSIRVLSDTFSFILQQAGPPPQSPTAFKAPAHEEINLNELITKVKSIHKTLEKINKSGKKSYLVELL